jgi:hypothetical protein
MGHGNDDYVIGGRKDLEDLSFGFLRAHLVIVLRFGLKNVQPPSLFNCLTHDTPEKDTKPGTVRAELGISCVSKIAARHILLNPDGRILFNGTWKNELGLLLPLHILCFRHRRNAVLK